jgi:hypothetical protein
MFTASSARSVVDARHLSTAARAFWRGLAAHIG